MNTHCVSVSAVIGCLRLMVLNRYKFHMHLGTGNLTIEIGDAYQERLMMGVDASIIQPTWVPQNSEFQIVDMEDLWNWMHRRSFIFGRQLVASIQDWPQLVHQCHE